MQADKLKLSLQSPEVKLFILGAAILFWELLLIRWLGACIRIVGYFTNFVLISAFFGLGTGALLVRFNRNFSRFLVPILAIAIVMGPLLGSYYHLNPAVAGEVIWEGAPKGVVGEAASGEFFGQRDIHAPYWLLLLIVYTICSGIFAAFGEWLGRLFGTLPPLRAYTYEIAGSLFGILLFAIISFFQWPPTVWFILGFLLVFAIQASSKRSLLVGVSCAVLSVMLATPYVNEVFWSRYYKIHVAPVQKIREVPSNKLVRFDYPVGFQISVNNDYHQMILDLHPTAEEHPFLRSWRIIYDTPYHMGEGVPPGPVLIIGAGTGNDVSAALRAGCTQIDAIEIDPMIVQLGQGLHPERPYANPAVNIVVDDARSYLARTNKKYSKVIFGFLDSHTLMSSFSSLRLDNFVYTEEAMRRVKEVLLPGGRVYVTFATNRPWIHERMIGLLDRIFDEMTVAVVELDFNYSNGTVYMNARASDTAAAATKAPSTSTDKLKLPTDDWPYLYMRDAKIPSHYIAFITIIVLTGLGSLFLLPKGQRSIKLPYFFMGAGFFLLETSNVVSLSLLYGSTWSVNVMVFSGILFMILMGNLTCARMSRPHFGGLFALLLASLLVAFAVKPSMLLALDLPLVRGVVAVCVFLGPVYLASVIFGHLIKEEPRLYQAYGSNLLGAVIGGSCEYMSILVGLKSLLLITFLFYALAYFFTRRASSEKTGQSDALVR